MHVRILTVFSLAMILLLPGYVNCQVLQPGFDKQEYLELLRISSRFGDSAYRSKIPAPQSSVLKYRSTVLGLDNLWDLYQQKRGVAVISIRGTTENVTSWMANFYAAMVPAKGELKLNKTETWKYELAKNPSAAVHVGWLVAMAFLSKDILPKMDSAYRSGTKEFIIMGHSQGGAIAYLLTAYLYNLRAIAGIPNDMKFKTYCSAGPKPGNLYFAYEYEDLTKNGWAMNVVNTADWVPETPMSVQTMEDLNPINPFADTKKIFKGMKFPQNLFLKYVFNRLDKPTKKARKNYQKYLGNFVGKNISKKLAGFTPPQYYNSVDYVRTGQQIVLLAGNDYYEKFPQVKERIFVNHLHAPYIYLTENYGKDPVETGSKWILEVINWKGNNASELYPDKKPFINFNPAEGKITGNTSCNSFSASPVFKDNTINFNVPVISTRMACQGNGEMMFFQALQSVNKYEIKDKQLLFYRDQELIMQFAAQ
jgi:heat shock protein HslJ